MRVGTSHVLVKKTSFDVETDICMTSLPNLEGFLGRGDQFDATNAE